MKRMFVDCETTGTDSRINCIHQLSGCLEIDGKVVEEFDFKIRPFEGCIIKQEALEVSNITIEDIMQYPPEMESYYEFKNMLARYINEFDKTQHFFIIGYNVKFDAEFINAMFLRNDDKFFYSLCWGNVIDAMSLASDMLATIRHEMSDFKLNTVARQLGIIVDETKLHNAQYDIEITREVYYKVKRPDIYDIDITELINDSNINIVNCNNNTTGPWDIKPIQDRVEEKIEEKSIVKLYDNLEDISQNEIEAAKQDIKSAFLQPTIIKENKVEENKTTSMIKIETYEYKISFGEKHKNETIKQIIEYDPQYIMWLNDNHIKGIFVSDEIMNACLRQKHKLDNSTPFHNGRNKKIEEDDLPF